MEERMARTRKTSPAELAPPPKPPEDDFWTSLEEGDDDPFAEPSEPGRTSHFKGDDLFGDDPFTNGSVELEGDEEVEWGSEQNLQEHSSRKRAEDELVRTGFAAALEKLRNPDPMIGSLTVQMLSNVGMERLDEQIAAASCLGGVKAEVADCEVLVAEYKPAMIACGRAIKVGVENARTYRLGLGVSIDGRLHFLSAEDLDPFFIAEESKPVRDVADYLEILAVTIAGLQIELKDHATAVPQAAPERAQTYGALRRALNLSRELFRHASA
jgi:hypothetical protein